MSEQNVWTLSTAAAAAAPLPVTEERLFDFAVCGEPRRDRVWRRQKEQ